MCIITSARIYTSLPCLQARHWRRATAASPPCPPGRFHWPSATLSAQYHPVKVHTLKRQCPAPSMLLLLAAHHLVPIVHTEYHDKVPPPAPAPALWPHSSHHTRSQSRLVPYLQVQGVRELGRLHQLRRRCLLLHVARQPQGRFAVLYVCVYAFMCVGGGCRRTSRVEKGEGERVTRGYATAHKFSPMSIDMNVYFCFEIYVNVYIHI